MIIKFGFTKLRDLSKFITPNRQDVYISYVQKNQNQYVDLITLSLAAQSQLCPLDQLYDAMQSSNIIQLNNSFINWIMQPSNSKLFLAQPRFVPQLQANHVLLKVLTSQVIVLFKWILKNKNSIDLEFVEQYLEFLYQTVYYIRLDIAYSLYTLRILFYYSNEGQKILTSNQESLLLSVVESIQLNIQKCSQQQLILICYQLSKINLAGINLMLHYEIFNAINKQLNINKLTPQELKSFLYSIGKTGFLTPSIQEYILKSTNNEPKAQLSLSLSGTNLLYDQFPDHFNQLNQSIFQNISNLPVQEQIDVLIIFLLIFFFLKLGIQLYTILLRTQQYEDSYWIHYFSLIDKFPQNPIHYQMQNDLLILAPQFTPKIQELMQQKIDKELVIQTLNQQKDQFPQNSQFFLQKLISDQLDLLAIDYEINILIDAQEIDILIPSKNLIIEAMGPFHFVNFEGSNQKGYTNFPLSSRGDVQLDYCLKYNLITQHKLRKLRSLGYKVECIDFYSLREKNIQEILTELLN